MEIPDGFAQVNLKFTGSGLPTGAQVVFGVDVTTYAGTPSTLGTEVASIWDSSGMDLVQVNSVTLSGVLVKFGPTLTGPSAEVAASVVGKDTSGGAPANTAFLIQKRTVSGGRSGRGRMYIPGVDETEVDAAGTVSPALLSGIQSAATNFLTALTGNDTPMVVLHNAGAPLSSPSIVTSLQVQSRVATQRRRLRR